MRADWKGEAQSFIRQATAALPADATLKQRRAALRKVASAFHMGTSWGAKVWSREVRKYLERLGLEPLNKPPTGRALELAQAQGWQRAKLSAPDITFPYRQEEGNGG